MPSNLSVKVTADVQDLQVKFAVAKAEVSGLTSEMNKLARASAAGMLDEAGAARLQQVAGDMLHARAAAAGYAGELEKAGVAVGAFGGRLESAHGSISTTAREVRRLFDEIKAGSSGGAEVTLLRLGQHLLGLGPAALLGVGAVGALAAGLAYLGVRAIETSRALDSMKLGAEFAGNFDTSRAQLEQFTEELTKASNVSHSQALAIVANFARIPEATTPEINALTELISGYARVTGEQADKASESVAKLMNPKTPATELTRSIGGLTQAQLDMAQAADRSGNASDIVAAKLELLGSVTTRSRASIVQSSASLADWHNWWTAYKNALIDGFSAEQTHTQLVAQATAAEQANTAAIRQKIAAIAATPPTAEQTLQVGVETAQKENPVALQAQEAKSKIEEMTAALAIAKEKSDQVNINLLNASLSEAREKLSALTLGPVLDRMRTDMAQIAATWDGTQSGMLEKQRQVAAATVAALTAGTKEYLGAVQEQAQLEVRIRQTTGEEVIAAARTQISALSSDTQAGTLQRLASERDVWQQILAGDKITAAQRLEVQRSLNQSIAADERESQAETIAKARQNADTDIAISKLTIDAKKSQLDTEVVATQAAAARRLAILKDLTAQEFQLDQQQLSDQLATLNSESIEYNRVMNQIRELKAKNVLDLENLDKQYAEESRKLTEQQATQWKTAVGEIEGAESTLVSNLLSKRKTLAQSLLQISAQLVTQEIANDVKAMTTRLLLSESAQTQQKALEQGGYLYHLLINMMKTRDTIAQQTAQTTAVTSGAAAQQTAQTSAAAAGTAAQSALAVRSVESDAARSFAAVYASAAEVPVVGWIIAPGAAAAAFAEVSAMSSLAALDVGAWDVPHDMVAQIHEGETVMPKTFAEGFRNSAESGGGGDTYHGDTFHLSAPAIDSRSLHNYFSDRGNNSVLAAAIRKAFNRGSPHLRR